MQKVCKSRLDQAKGKEDLNLADPILKLVFLLIFVQGLCNGINVWFIFLMAVQGFV